MDHLDEISVEELQAALDEVDGAKPAQRLLAAIAYKNGVSQTDLADWYGVQRRTIYSWLMRLESRPLADAVVDADRSGRPRKLTADQRETFEETLQQPPSEVGVDASAWSPPLVQRYLRETFDVEYSRPSCRRLMKEAGLSYRPARRTGSDGSDGSGGWAP